MGKSKKRYLKNRQKKIERQKRKKKRRTKRRNKGREKHLKHIKESRDFVPLKPRSQSKFKKVAIPENFSLVNNPTQILRQFKNAEDIINNRYQVDFDLSNIKEMTPDAIALLVAKVNDSRFHRGIRIKGNTPQNPKLTDMLIQSGFYDHVSARGNINKSSNHILLHKKTKKKVENNVAKRACKLAVDHSFKDSRIFRPIYQVLIECMANTKNHADTDEDGKYNWWLFVYTKPGTNITAFCFLDLGVGIFKSLPVQNFLRKILTKTNVKSNTELVKPLLNGKINSRTGLKERGKGMPLIYEKSKDQHFKKFILISNDVYADLKNDSQKKLENELNGTFYYWEISNN